MIAGRSPPGPLRCGSTTCSANPAAAAASNALPPRSRTAMPAAEASQCVDATIPNVPRSSGRVVNPLMARSYVRDSGRGSGAPGVPEPRVSCRPDVLVDVEEVVGVVFLLVLRDAVVVRPVSLPDSFGT